MSKLSENPAEHLTAQAPALVITEFSVEQRQALLRIAHEAIFAVLNRRPFPDVEPALPGLSEPRGVFTTLYLLGELRGCVGYVLPVTLLYRAVAETACAAAFEDSRFFPVAIEEALLLEISLSVLSPLFPVYPEAVEVGRHGLIISQGIRRGLLLPQVPVEHGWDRETFLEQTCLKGGLSPDAWRKEATLEAFTAEVFSDGDVKASC